MCDGVFLDEMMILGRKILCEYRAFFVYITICYVPDIVGRPLMPIYNAVSLLELCGPGRDILELMLAFVNDRRVPSINVLLNPHLRDALLFFLLLHNLC
jgi:hypothetical protein